MKDPVVEEVRSARAMLAAKHKFNLHAIVEDARRHQQKSGHRIIKLVNHSSIKSELTKS